MLVHVTTSSTDLLMKVIPLIKQHPEKTSFLKDLVLSLKIFICLKDKKGNNE